MEVKKPSTIIRMGKKSQCKPRGYSREKILADCLDKLSYAILFLNFP